MASSFDKRFDADFAVAANAYDCNGENGENVSSRSFLAT